jgi:CheY-like chemotaxis protein
MQKRIRRVLLVCSNYDEFLLEVDGRIDEQIFNEYVSLNLRYPPSFIHADTAKEALRILDEEEIDLVIEMLSIGDIDTFKLARVFKTKHPKVPVVVLTPFSREVSLRLEREDLTAIDYVFCWLGNADLLVAIIKLIEDKMNAPFDIQKVGVQAILLVEDSIRYVSTYLPTLYRIILQQSREFASEALNEHQQMLRMRGRPKILFAKSYDEAIETYNKFKNNLIGVISDVSYKKTALSRDTERKLGLQLCKVVLQDDKFVPFLLQSSDIKNKPIAHRLNAGFVHKYSKNLNNELKEYVTKHFAFGPFVFVDPETCEAIDEAHNLRSLQKALNKIPDHVLKYHAKRDDFSKWLNARALFPIAKVLKETKFEDFPNLEELRLFIDDVISQFRSTKGRGVIAEFKADKFDKYMMFSRIGSGTIGGKARGLAFIDQIIKRNNLSHKFEGITITIPRTVVLSTDVFDEFMESNKLFEVGISDATDQEILDKFLASYLPERLLIDLNTFIEDVQHPIAIRSSSKLEDSHYQPFAGIYNTYMIPHCKDDKCRTLELLQSAIKSVYASVYFRASKSYMTATQNIIDEEKMGVILQEVAGAEHGDVFYPTMSGVARSSNFYPIEPEKKEEGIVNIAYGLGKYIVDGGMSIRFSPYHPHKILQLSSPELAMRDTQKNFIALDMNPDAYEPSLNDDVNLRKIRLKHAEDDPCFRFVASTFDLHDKIIRDTIHAEGRKLVTFSPLLQHHILPLADVLKELLSISQREMNNSIEIEFAFNMKHDSPEPEADFYFLQIRPIVESDQTLSIVIDDKLIGDNTLIYSESALGNGITNDILDLVCVNLKNFNPQNSRIIAEEMDKINQELTEAGRYYVLVGPGRWGSSDPFLGIPVKWPNISNARTIIEVGLDKFDIEPSQGTHFFHNLTSFRVGYFNLFRKDFEPSEFYNKLQQHKLVFENEYIQHYQFSSALKVAIDGRSGKGIVNLPE